MNPSPTTEERLWAALSHISALAFGMGIWLPVLGWSEQRHRSKYASFQCLQALGYQSLGYTVWLLSYLVVVIGLSVLLFAFALSRASAGTPIDDTGGVWPALFILAVVGLLGLYAIFPAIAAISCVMGREYRYPVLGARLEGYLGYRHTGNAGGSGLDEERQVRWVAAMGHFSVIIAFWGLLAPLSAWILQGRRHAFLKFQSIQATVYQVFVNLLYMSAGVFYFFGVVILFVMVGLEGDPRVGPSGAGMTGLIVFLVALLLAALIMLAVPLFHILGQWAGYRLLKGEDYRYPLIGRLGESYIKKRSPPAGDGGSSREPNS